LEKNQFKRGRTGGIRGVAETPGEEGKKDAVEKLSNLTELEGTWEELKEKRG